MGYSTKFSDSIHILAYICLFSDADLSSKAISTSIQANPAAVRRLMVKLRQANLLSTVPGASRPNLTRPPQEITLYDIYQAIEDDPRLFHVNGHTNIKCPAGSVIQQVLQDKYDDIQQNFEKQLAEQTLADVLKNMRQIGEFD